MFSVVQECYTGLYIVPFGLGFVEIVPQRPLHDLVYGQRLGPHIR